jgi:TM2 domain-containing membrane protein YozV
VSRRSLVIAYILWAFLGPLGGHRFYLRDFGWGIIFFFTGGLFSIGWFVDAFTLPAKIDRHNREVEAGLIAPARLVGSGYRRL